MGDDQVAQVTSDQQFLQMVAEYFAPHRQKVMSKIDADQKLYEEYFNSGLSMQDFCERNNLSVQVLRDLRQKYDLPSAPLTHSKRNNNVVRSAARKIRNQLGIAKLNDCNCYGCSLLKQVLAENKKAVE